MSSDSLDLLEFLDQLDADSRAHRDLPLSHYLQRFPRIEVAVAREYLQARAVPEPNAAPPLQPGADASQQVGPFRLIRELGRGGQGTVHLAEDVRVGRLVALKLLASPAAAISTAARGRFRREAESIARLEHRYLCSIYEADLESETPYIAMRYVEGQTLRERLTGAREAAGLENPRADRTSTELMLPGRSEIPGVLLLIEHAARALHAAHEAGIVHRDIKPGNIQIDMEGRPVILDFGLARFDEAHASDRMTLTAPGQVFGTPAYMAPEQFASEHKLVDHRGDIYALGVVLYECLTLSLPMPADAVFTRDPAQWPRPRPPQQHNPAIGDELRVVIETAMAAEPRQRYQTAIALAEDLRRIREFEPIVARPASTWLRLRRWTRRNRRLVSVGSVILLSSLLAAWAWIDKVLTAAQADHEKLAKAGHERDTARASKLAAIDPQFALMWAREAAKTGLDDEVNTAAMDALVHNHRVWTADGPVNRQMFSFPCFAMGGDHVGTITAKHEVVIKHLVTGAAVGAMRGNAENSSLSATEDGSEFFATWQDGAVNRWDLEVGCQPFLCAAPGLRGKQVLSVSPVPGNSTCLLFVTRQHDLVLWDRQASRELFHVRHAIPTDQHLTAILSRDGRRLVAAAGRPFDRSAKLPVRGGARVWTVPDGVLQYEIADRGQRINGMEFAPDGHWLALVYVDGSLEIHDVEKCQRIGSAKYAGEAYMARFHPDGERVVVCIAESPDIDLKEAPIRVLDLGGKELKRLRGHKFNGATALAFSADGQRLASAGNDNRLCLHSAAFSQETTEQSMGRLWTRPARAEWSRDGRFVVTCDVDGVVDCWDADQPSVRILSHSSEVTAVCFSPDADLVLTGCVDGSLRVWDRARGKLVHELAAGAKVRRLQVTPDGSTLMVVAAGPFVRFFDSKQWQATSYAVSAEVTVAALSVDGMSAAIGDFAGGVTLVDLKRNQSQRLGTHTAAVTCATFAADGKSLVTGGADRAVLLWNLQDTTKSPTRCHQLFADSDLDVVRTTRAVYELPGGAEWLILTEHPRARIWEPAMDRIKVLGPAVRVALRPQGDMLAVAWAGDRADVRSWPGRTPMCKLANMGPPSVLTFGPRGCFLLSASHEGTAQLLRTDDQPRPWATMRGHQEQPILSAALSWDERWVATASLDKTVRIWPTQPFAPEFMEELKLPAISREVLEFLDAAPGR